MFTYEQKTGRLLHNGTCIATGYSGFGQGKNNPLLQNVADVGPICCGRFRMEVIKDADGNACDYEHKKAPVIRLIAQPGTQMFGRAGFLIHGDSISAPGTASHGCVIEDHNARVSIAESISAGDDILEVVQLCS